MRLPPAALLVMLVPGLVGSLLLGPPTARAAPAAPPDIRHIHASGLATFGGTAAERGTLRRRADRMRAEASLVTHTEMVRTPHAEAILGISGGQVAGWSHRWVRFGPGSKEVAVEWKDAVWEQKANLLRPLSRRAAENGRRITASGVVLSSTRRPGEELAVIGAHLPANVEAAWTRGSRNVRAHKAALDGLRGMVRDVRREHPRAGVVVAADWNLDHRRARWRGVIRRHLGDGFLPTWDRRYRGPGTLGSRLVDASWSTGLARTGSRVLGSAGYPTGPRGPSDHRPYLATYDW